MGEHISWNDQTKCHILTRTGDPLIIFDMYFEVGYTNEEIAEVLDDLTLEEIQAVREFLTGEAV